MLGLTYSGGKKTGTLCSGIRIGRIGLVELTDREYSKIFQNAEERTIAIV